MIYYVATLARYELIEAGDEEAAREKGATALADLCPGAPVVIRTVRPATPDEIELDRWHREAR